MHTKLVKDLAVGDRIETVNPAGVAEVRKISKSRLLQAAGGCFAIDLKVVKGSAKGQWIRDQHHPGNDIVRFFPTEARHANQ